MFAEGSCLFFEIKRISREPGVVDEEAWVVVVKYSVDK